MKKYNIISISSNSMTAAQTEEHRRLLVTLTNDPQVPWWQNKPTVPSTRYVIDIFTAEECGLNDPFEKMKKRFKLWQIDGNKSRCLDDGIVEQEKTLINRDHEDRRRFWLKGHQPIDFFVETPIEGDDTPQSIIASGVKKCFDDMLARRQRGIN